jgi:branched-chain amino acid transport system permease protein
MKMLPQLIVNGLITGGTYALAAIGYSMVYSVLKFANFANGAVAMIGAYLTFLLVTELGIYLPLAFLISILATALLGVATDKIAYKPLRQAPKISSLITAMAISFVLEAVVLLVVGAEYRPFPLPVAEGWRLGSVYITPVQAGILVASVVCVVGLWYILHKTKIGRAMRAVADNPELATINGTDTDRVISAVFAIGAALAAVAGTFVGMDIALNPTMGFNITVKGFAAVVLGGMGNVAGAVLGGLILGMMENAGVWYLAGGDGRWKVTIAYAVLMFILVVKPAGLLGSKEESRVF